MTGRNGNSRWRTWAAVTGACVAILTMGAGALTRHYTQVARIDRLEERDQQKDETLKALRDDQSRIMQELIRHGLLLERIGTSMGVSTNLNRGKAD